MSSFPGLSLKKAEAFTLSLKAEPRYHLAQNVATCGDPLELCLERSVVQDTLQVFQHAIPAEGKPVTNQKNSGRCWIFSCLNVMRLPFMKKLNIEEFEFSQAHLFFWDKVERCYYFLDAYVKTAKNEPVDSRLVQFLLANPCSDGGQWDMLVNLIEKHGVVPKKLFPESFTTEASRRMNEILNYKMREYCHRLRNMVETGCNEDELCAAKDAMIEESSCFGRRWTGIRTTWPVQRSWWRRSIASMLVVFASSSTLAFARLSSQEICRIFQRQH